jgi:ring-1,2-phenylacetyl-CoA epoxidase subunit PaaE
MSAPERPLSVVGQRLPKVDAWAKVTGETRFADDLVLPRMAYAKLLRAQHPHALIRRIDAARAAALLDHWVPQARMDAVFVCGPEGMMDAVVATLRARGLPDARIKVERFAASIPKHTHVPRPLPEAAHSECEVTVIQDGARKSYFLTKGEDNILDAGLRNGIELPYSCKGGVCSTCRCKLIEGEVDMDVNFALEDYEVARGFILACQSYPATDKVVVDFDQTGMG